MTLVETLVAIAIMSIIMLSATALLSNISQNEKRNRSITEVEYQASAIMYEITQSMRNASAVSSPAVGATSTSLTLAMTAIPSQNPTVFSFVFPTVSASKAGGSALALSSNTVEITSLIFQNISASSTKGAVRISLAMKATNPSGKPELVYETSRTTTVTLR